MKKNVFEICGMRRAKEEKTGRSIIQLCFLTEKEDFEGFYVEKATCYPENVSYSSPELEARGVVLNAQCKIFWERNSYRIEELFIIA